MKKLSREEAAKILEGMKVKIKIPKAAVTQWERNAALDMAIEVLNCSEIPNKSDTISRQAALDAIMGQPPEPHYPSWYAAQIEKLPAIQPDLSGYSGRLWKSAYERGKAEAKAEIIRCKDCKYWKRSSCCEGYCGEIDMEGFDEDHYCGFAERRTE